MNHRAAGFGPRQRVNSLPELIDAYDGEVEYFGRMIANRFAGHRRYRVFQQIDGVGPTFHPAEDCPGPVGLAAIAGGLSVWWSGYRSPS
ncbi:MAG: hypothetical protein ACRDRA_15740 [Pseudonocardiaceae bacterium]